MQDLTKAAIDYINGDIIAYADMLYLMQRGTAEIRYATEKGLLIRDTYSNLYTASAVDKETGLSFAGLITDYDTVAVHEELFGNDLAEKLGLERELSCHIWAYMKEEKVPVPAGADIRTLDISHLGLMVKYYHLFTDEEYFADRLNRGEMLGIFVDGEPAGFIGQHDEGSIGMLEIFPQYRRRGLAYAVEGQMINNVLDSGRIPYDEVLLGNEASYALQTKLGFTMSPKVYTWYKKPR